MVTLSIVMAGPRPGHPRLLSKGRKSWMPATGAGMTVEMPCPLFVSSIHRPAVDCDGLPGDEIALRRRKKDQGPDQVGRIGITLDGAALDRVVARALDMGRVVLDDAVGQREAGRKRVDADAIGTDRTRERARERAHRALRGDVVHQLR